MRKWYYFFFLLIAHWTLRHSINERIYFFIHNVHYIKRRIKHNLVKQKKVNIVFTRRDTHTHTCAHARTLYVEA